MFKTNFNITYLTLGRFLSAVIMSLSYSNFNITAPLDNKESILTHSLCKEYFKSLYGQSSI